MDDAKKVLARVTLARQDRARHQVWIDETLRLALPTYRRIADAQSRSTNSSNAAQKIEEQDDQFDNTLEIVAEDFASDMISTFTPRHERWVMFEPAESLSEGQRREIAPQLKAIGDTIFAEIERSNYWDAAQECFAFWGVSAMALAVSDMGALNPLHFQPIEIPDLLMERGPDGSVTGKWREMSLTPAEQHMLWGVALPSEFPMPTSNQANRKQAVVEGCDRDYSTPGVERWNYRIMVGNKQRFHKVFEGAGSCAVIACRFRQQADSAWGPGPFKKATPRARVLDELGYLNLKGLGNSIDAPFSYEEDGLANFEGGIEAGKAYARAPGSKPPEPFMPEARFDASFFKEDEMRKEIKRAAYQDRPEQPGDTPPTLGQWMDEKAWNTRRKELPRDRCVREWVLPIIERVAWILAQRGVLPEVKLKGGQVVNVRPISPLSKAKDLEDMNLTGQVLAMASNIGAALQVGVQIDATATMENLIATAKERHIVMKSPEQIAQEAAMAAAAQGGMPDGATA
ncbi:portal protein [Brevundimonas sp.]|uniref:portal protein n=1 Tax=Brevundimonas sp. TaxID=1871086 RepID=UPI0025C4FC86|nr:portal protein [Brevundimonas sp.]